MRRLIPMILPMLVMAACSKSPEGVLSKGEMADLLVDIHKTESVIEFNNKEYASDSVKQLMKQSVLARHNVTSEQLDSSMMWYGRHIEDYMDVYDVVTERLESELREMEISGTAEASQIELAGDSVDVWGSGRLRRFTPLQPSGNLRFTLRRDGHWEKGDIYRWKFRVSGPATQPVRWMISAEYSDNTVATATGRFSGQGWHELTFPTDTTQIPRMVHGYIEYVPYPGSATMYADSISLTRMRIGHRSVTTTEPLTRYSTSH